MRALRPRVSDTVCPDLCGCQLPPLGSSHPELTHLSRKAAGDRARSRNGPPSVVGGVVALKQKRRINERAAFWAPGRRPRSLVGEEGVQALCQSNSGTNR